MIKKKSLGQNFLRSKTALSAIIAASNPTSDDIVLEIGPGEGTLTAELLNFAGKVIAVEKDARLIPVLKEKFSREINAGKFDLVEKDILDFDENLLAFYKHPYKIVANIPYYITGQVIRKFLEAKNQPESMTLLVQKEVAERITSKNNSPKEKRKESLLSLSVKAYGIPKYIKTIGRGAFSPQPNVDSAIIHILDISRKNFKEINEKRFFEILHAGFAHKRKLLLSNLLVLFQKDKILRAFEICGLNPQCRAEDIPLMTWIKFCNTISS